MAVMAAAGGVVIWEIHANRDQAARIAQLSAEIDRAKQQMDALRRQAVNPPAAPEPTPPEVQNLPRGAQMTVATDDAALISRLRSGLADANASIARLQSRADEDQAELQNLRIEKKRLSGSEADLTESLSTANQTIDALQRELKSNREHVTQVEIAYQKLRDQGGADARKLAELQQLAVELQDIYQHREVYLNSILRRYRQITDQYRAMSGVLQAQRTDAPGAGSADLARIQDSIAMAEEDLRQLNALSAQALRIQKKMTGK